MACSRTCVAIAPWGRPHKRMDDHVLAVSANIALALIFLVAMLLKQFEVIKDEVRPPRS